MYNTVNIQTFNTNKGTKITTQREYRYKKTIIQPNRKKKIKGISQYLPVTALNINGFNSPIKTG